MNDKTKPAEPAPVPIKRYPPLTEGRMTLRSSGQITNDWDAITPLNTPFSAFLDPHYLAHVAAKLHSGDEIHVQTDDRSYCGVLHVWHSDRTCAFVEELVYRERKIDLSRIDTTAYEVAFKGPHALWSIVDKRSQKIVKDKLPDKQTAEGFLNSYLRAMAA